MKKTWALQVFPAAFLLLLACSGDKPQAGEPAAAAAPVTGSGSTVVAGKPYDCTYFAMAVADGWEAGPLTFGMVNVLPRGKVSPGLYFKFEGDGNAAGTAEGSIETMVKKYGGSAMEDTMIAGGGFKTTTYSYSGMTQTMHVAFRNGTKVTITIEGKDAKDNPDIQAMLKSLVLK
jgi:hypothetical protein